MKWSGYGIPDVDGNTDDNGRVLPARYPGDVVRAFAFWSEEPNNLLETDRIDLDSINRFNEYWIRRDVKLCGMLPPRTDMSLVDVVAEITRFMGDVETSEGVIRVLPLEYNPNESAEITDVIHWRDFLNDPSTPTDDGVNAVQNDIDVYYSNGFWDNSERLKINLRDLESIGRYGTFKGHGLSHKGQINLPYAETYYDALAIGKNWLELKKFPMLVVPIRLNGLKWTDIQLGDSHIAIIHPTAPNPTSQGIGWLNQPVYVVGKRFDLDNDSVTIFGRIDTVRPAEFPIGLEDVTFLITDDDAYVTDSIFTGG